MCDGHRERLRERYRRAGFNAFAEYELLELLLACVPVPKGLCARTIAIQRASRRPLRAEVFAPKGPGAPRPCETRGVTCRPR